MRRCPSCSSCGRVCSLRCDESSVFGFAILAVFWYIKVMLYNNGQFKKGQHWRPRKPYWQKEWLRREYLENNRSAMDIALQFGITENAILHWLAKHEIPRRSISETRKIKYWGLSGKDNPMHGKTGAKSHNWKGGITPKRQRDYSRSDIQAFLTSVRCRDKVCQNCGAQSRLDVHHIKSFADFPDYRYDADNCISLCRSCHMWAHSSKNKEKLFLP